MGYGSFIYPEIYERYFGSLNDGPGDPIGALITYEQYVQYFGHT